MNFDNNNLSYQQQLSTSQIPKSPTLSLQNHRKIESIEINQIPHLFLNRSPRNLLKFNYNVVNSSEPIPSEKISLQILKRNTRFLQTNKNLLHISLNLETKTSFDLHFLLSRLKYLQNLTSLDLNIIGEEYLTLSNIKIFSLIISNLKNLTTFSFQFPEDFLIPFRLIDAVFFALKRLASLSNLTLKFHSRRGFGDDHIKKLALHLKKLSKLQSLILNLHKSLEITETGLQPFSLAFKNLPLLSEVSIKLYSSQGSSASTFQELFSGLATLKFLKKLDLSIRPDSDCNLTESLSLGLAMLHAPSLREISLKLYPNPSDSGISDFSKALAGFSYLKTLSLSFSKNSARPDQGIFQLSSALQSLTSLTSLSLFALRKSLELISQGITQLKDLSFDFVCCSEEKSPTISSLQHLKKLTLKLIGYRTLNTEDLASLIQYLEILKDLPNLTLDLRKVQLTDESLQGLVSSFSNLSKMTHITLKLKSNLTDADALRSIAQGIQSVSGLYSFSLVFVPLYYSSYIEGFGILCDTLQNLTSLKEIEIEVKTRRSGLESKISSLEKVKLVTAKLLSF